MAVLQFEELELGPVAPPEQVEELLLELYGSARGAGGRRVLAESAEQLLLEEEAAPPSPGRTDAVAQLPLAQPAAARARPPEQPLRPSGKLNTLDAAAAAAADTRLSGRMGGAGGETTLGFGQPAAAAPGAKKRLAPEPLSSGGGGNSDSQLMPPPAPRPAGASGRVCEHKRPRVEPTHMAAAAGGEPSTAEAQRAAAGPLAVAPAPGALLLRPPKPPAELIVPLGRLPSLFDDGEAAGPGRELRLLNRDRGPGGRPQADLQCSEGSTVQWTDSASGLAAAACGSPNFAAVGMADGSLLLYSRAGRRLTAPLKLGAGIARLACDGGWRLLALTTGGVVRLLDVERLACLLSASLAPLLEGGGSVLDARLSRAGQPVLTLSDASAYAWSAELQAWLCVADDSCAASQFAPLLRLGAQGELSGLQAEALAAARRGAASTLPGSGAAQRQLSRAHLEANLGGALALRSPTEYRRWLVAYARFLAEHGDAPRLSELCDTLLGADEAGGGGACVEALPEPAELGCTGSGPEEEQGRQQLQLHGRQPGAWQPRVLGLSKRALLRGDVLREVARNRSLSWLFSKYRDALDELAATEAAGASTHTAPALQHQHAVPVGGSNGQLAQTAPPAVVQA